ncbi:HesA/MoeB/ThiF family protein [Arcanobacterium ihumii]|uniref:HesA/MoeB/ThiF family protein n=1 Tax=Arcanobacterium ihumii TaxID=2138162 RepID=UPI000F547134|nr:ThiF family adenylyltransferase [Arcanobacterium ihumii]
MKPLVDVGPELSPSQKERFARHLVLTELGEEGQRRLCNARVLMVGAGGLGSPALLYLAAAGIGTIGIVDDDVVSLSNLQRQVIHSNAAIGEPKVESAKRRLLELDPDLTINTYQLRLDDSNVDEILADYDLVVEGTDNQKVRFVISDAAARAQKPMIWASVQCWQAQISVFWAGERAVEHGMPAPNGITLRDVFPAEAPSDAIPSSVDIGLLGALPGQTGVIEAIEAIKVITGIGTPLVGRIKFIDLLNATDVDIPISPAP